MHLIHNHGGISSKREVSLDFLEQDAVGTKLDMGVWGEAGAVASMISDDLTEASGYLTGNTMSTGHSGDASRLGDCNHAGSSLSGCKAVLEKKLGDLSRLAGAGGACYDGDIVFVNGFYDFLFVHVYGEGFAGFLNLGISGELSVILAGSLGRFLRLLGLLGLLG